jgi:trehalose synthase
MASRRRHVILGLATLLGVLGLGCQSAPPSGALPPAPRLLGPAAPYNLKAANGISCTSATVAAAALGLRDLGHLSDAQRQDIQRAHLLMAMFNAMQPGVFALSGWDLVGALTLPAESVKSLLADGDTRWINRGAYDLLGANAGADRSSAELPRARALYGTLAEQLEPGDCS